MIGTDAAEEYVAADTLIFNDTDAVAVSAYTEIRPGKCSDTHDTLEIAYQVFKTLNGPLSKACEAQIGSIYNADHALVINEISDNSIDIYYDNAINILIGDKYFMKAHKIKVKTDTNLTAAVKGLDRSVIYLAFNGVPKLGFIISSKVNNSFIQITHALEEACIKVMVETYEPQINQIYFEQNMGPNSPPVGVIKPDTYDDENLDSVCNSGIVSSADSISVAKSILLSRDIVKHKKSLKLIERAVMIGEIVLAMVLASICCFNAQYGILQGIFNNIISIFYTAMFLGATPGIIKLILINRRHTAKHKQNGDKKQK